jgi:hypothetical protein
MPPQVRISDIGLYLAKIPNSLRKAYIFSRQLLRMPSKKYSDRTTQVTFSSLEEYNAWLQDAQNAGGMPLTKYILEMARRGREGEAARPADQSRELTSLREENARLATSEGELRKLYEKAEGELFKLRHATFAMPLDGIQEPAEKLIKVLQSSARPISNQELLRALGIDARDIGAMKILLGQLQALRDFGQLQETPLGWKWVG